MFRWYQKADVCLAYLSDVAGRDIAKDVRAMKQSRWFTRGWTLQELVAPRHIVFFTREWTYIGQLKGQDPERSISLIIRQATGIPMYESWRHGLQLRRFSIAQRMSWASQRGTTRGEDMAYCLLGIVGVNMPILYGEGARRAFARLQEEIIRTSSDQTIFAWRWLGASDSGLLAPSVRNFSNVPGIVMVEPFRLEQTVLTNIGLSIRLRLVAAEMTQIRLLQNPVEPVEWHRNISAAVTTRDIGNVPVLETDIDEVYGALQCAIRDDEGYKIVAVALHRHRGSVSLERGPITYKSTAMFRRIKCTHLFLFPYQVFQDRPDEQILVLEEQQMMCLARTEEVEYFETDEQIPRVERREVLSKGQDRGFLSALKELMPLRR